jgi:outer membrane receptor protein involved in Fe transport
MPSAGIQYQLWPEAMIYFSYSKGFKAGGINGQNPLSPNTPLNPIKFDPEHVNAYELGVKSKWFEDTLLLNVDVFRSDYSDLQVLTEVYSPLFNSYINSLANAATSRSQGVEFETQWAVTRGFRFAANVTYLDSHYVRYPNGTPTTLQNFCNAAAGGSYVLPYCSIYPNSPQGLDVADLSGQPTNNSPKWSGTIAASDTVPLPGNYKFTAVLNPYFTSRYNSTAMLGDKFFAGTAGYVRLDARLVLESPDDHWAVDLIGKNLTDRTVVSYQVNVNNVSTQQPRNVAIQFRYRW